MTLFVVYDLEYTTWPGARERQWNGPGEHREVVQIGAVILDAGFRERAALEILVRPRRNPQLSDYFTRLTGITQTRLDAEGIDADLALDRFLDFAGTDMPLVSNGLDAVVLAENCQLLGRLDCFSSRAVDVHPLLRSVSGRDDFYSCDLPAVFGLPHVGGAHTALADARCVAAALAKITQSNSKAFL